jgi:hypothetical protein
MNIETGAQMRVRPQGITDAPPGQRTHEGQGRVVQREGRRARNPTRHVGHAVMGDAIGDENRIGMGGRPRRCDASALVDGDIDDDRARAHAPHQLARHHLGCGGATPGTPPSRTPLPPWAFSR